MAKVLKSGRKQAGWSKEFKCTGWGNGGGGCNATLLISEYDFYETTSYLGGESERRATFCCPQCGVETDVNWDEAPPELRGERPSDAKRKEIALKNIKGGKNG